MKLPFGIEPQQFVLLATAFGIFLSMAIFVIAPFMAKPTRQVMERVIPAKGTVRYLSNLDRYTDKQAILFGRILSVAGFLFFLMLFILSYRGVIPY